MIYDGKAINVKRLEGAYEGIAELNFNLEGERVNKFDRLTLEELDKAGQALTKAATAKSDPIKGLLITSAKEGFIVGADITEFLGMFSKPEEALVGWGIRINKIFNVIEDLPVPSVVAVNGIALGGGLEMCLVADYRVMSTKAQIGLPEVKLGIFPGFGGTVRMPRIVGVDNAVEWISAGGQHRPDKALKDGVVDAVVEPEHLRDAALSLVKDCMDGKIDYKAKRQEKLEPLKLPPLENMMAFQTCSAMVKQKAGRNYPSPIAAVNAMQKHSTMKRDQALEIEAKGFAKMAKTEVAENLIGLFLKDQQIKKAISGYEKEADDTKLAAVLGAGIMGGGIAYQSAYKGVPIVMKDIAEAQLDLGMSEASKLLAKRVDKKRMTVAEMAKTLSKIRPTLSYGDFGEVDLVVEAVVENEKIKSSVLAEVEKSIKDGAILASNTSTISINRLAKSLKKPENFLGMHFFNPVHMMPLVEVIRGEKTSDRAVANTVAYAKAMGKTPIVVNDCPGFLVNRVLFPYFGGFSILLRDGVDFQKADKVMERFGWPMGPAYLMDVVGIDTGVHAAKVMAEGFPDRMTYDFKDCFTRLYEHERFGQKNNKGFYAYETDKKGKPKKVFSQEAADLLQTVCGSPKDFDDEEIINRLMIPMCLETVRCLEEDIVSSPTDADMAMIYGLGFPPFRGGPLRFIDTLGAKAFVELCDRYAPELGKLYEPTEKLREMAKKGETFFKG